MLFEVKDMDVGYAKRVVVHALSMTVDKGEIVGLIGHNGAGKTTTLKGIFGILKPSRGKIIYNGRDITGHTPIDNVKDGIAFLPQERFIFPELSVKENLDLGAYTVEDDVESRLETIYRLFPVLKERAWQRSSTLSGGERRMLGLGMTLITMPQLLVLDEPSLGLAPVLVILLLKRLQQIRETLGTSVILVEQNVKHALEIAHRVYVMKMGRIILEETGENLLRRGEWWDLF
jgi:branched-chain amino acid transport system ATP-binding protein